MDEIKNGAPGAHTNAADSAAVARGDDSMTTTPITLIEAITQALAWELNTIRRCWCWRARGRASTAACATAGLQQRFGSDRILDTPLDETTIAGLTTGRTRHEAGGRSPVRWLHVPDGRPYRLPRRTPALPHAWPPALLRCCACRGAVASARRNTTAKPTRRSSPTCRACAWCCSSSAAAYGLLLAAIREPDPVIYMEPKRIYRQYKEVVVNDGEALPLDVCFVLRDGTDVTLVTWGAQVKEALEVLTSWPGRHQCRSHRRGHAAPAGLRHHRRIGGQDLLLRDRAAPKTAGFGAEIAARLAEESIYDLLAPVERVTGYDTHIPLFRLEMKYLPSVERIVAAAKRAVACRLTCGPAFWGLPQPVSQPAPVPHRPDRRSRCP